MSRLILGDGEFHERETHARGTRAYVASQGRCLGRDGRITVQFDDSTIWLGAHAVTCVEGLLQT